MEIGDIYIYIWYVQDTLEMRAQWYVMWEELSVSHFLKLSNCLKRTLKNVLKLNRLLFNIRSSDCGATTMAKVSLHSTFTWSTVSFGYV